MAITQTSPLPIGFGLRIWFGTDGTAQLAGASARTAEEVICQVEQWCESHMDDPRTSDAVTWTILFEDQRRQPTQLERTKDEFLRHGEISAKRLFKKEADRARWMKTVELGFDLWAKEYGHLAS